MVAIREAYLEAAASVVRLLSDPAVAQAWDRSSVLPEFSVQGLAGHLGGQILRVSDLLDAEATTANPLSVMEFFAQAEALQSDLNSKANVLIRDYGAELASGGQKSLVTTVESAIAHQRGALPAEPADRIIAFLEKSMRLDDFLLTRILEIVVHSDDLALSAHLPTPDFPPHIFEPILDVLSRLAVARHGQLAVLRALSRAERAPTTIAGI